MHICHYLRYFYSRTAWGFLMSLVTMAVLEGDASLNLSSLVHLVHLLLTPLCYLCQLLQSLYLTDTLLLHRPVCRASAPVINHRN